jgi:VanZ family protein
MSRKFIIVAAWIVFAGIAFVTLSPIGLRPKIADPDLERFAAFAVLGLLLGMAYPGRRAAFALIIVIAAVLLEALQLFIPDRDGEFLDMLIKAAGVLAGMGVAIILSRLIPRTD